MKDIFYQYDFIRSTHEELSTHKYGGQLDVIYYSNALPMSVSNAIVLTDGTMSDHFMIYSTIQCEPDMIQQTIYEKYRSYKNIDLQRFKQDIKLSGLGRVHELPDSRDTIDNIVSL